MASEKWRSYSFLTISNSENVRVGSMERMFLLNPFWMMKQSIKKIAHSKPCHWLRLKGFKNRCFNLHDTTDDAKMIKGMPIIYR